MDKYRNHNYNYLPQHNKSYIRDHHMSTPSFSSTLLDQIYRSIDETTNDDHDHVKKKKQYFRTSADQAKDETDKIISFVNLNSSWSSSDSTSTGGLFSSEVESSRSSSNTTYCRPKSIKTSTDDDIKKILRDDEDEGGGVVKRSKLKALKIYRDLKKAKQQPISPGAKIATFLNSLFTSTTGSGGNAKKGKISSGADSLTSTSPACTTSKSCLSKSPGKLLNNTGTTKRSVRFYPVSVIVDEDCQPCGHKSLQQQGHGVKKNIDAVSDHENRINEELMYYMRRRKDQSVEEAARELLKNYQRKVEECQMELEHEDDDTDSYASSDLFELDNLHNIDKNGIDLLGNYMEELPVYETTYLETNRTSYC